MTAGAESGTGPIGWALATGVEKWPMNSDDARSGGIRRVTVRERRDMASSVPPRASERYARTGGWGQLRACGQTRFVFGALRIVD